MRATRTQKDAVTEAVFGGLIGLVAWTAYLVDRA